MKLPLSWIRDYVEITEDIETLCKKMVDIGLEIEEVIYLGQNVTNVKVCRILEIKQHPNADKLLCCKVDIGGEVIQIVTNDHRVKIGDKVPVALHNANLHNGLHITKGKMRGEESFGMFCGPEELGINGDMYPQADVDGVLILRDTANVGDDIRKEVGIDDYILDINITANRQDCNSVLGIAREVAVALGKKCKMPDISYTECETETKELVNVEVQAQDICNGYYMQGVTDVKIKKSPLWMTSRLAKIGLHGINNMVDITNYVLFEIGQPMHAFDYNDISEREIIIRRAKDGEKILPLDGKEYVLNNDDLVIADKTHAVGLAGIMGGADSGIKKDTSCVLFESASFARMNVRRTSHRLGLRSDSSARFEKGIDTYTNNLGLSRALHLVEKLGCGKVTRGRISIGSIASDRTVQFAINRIENLLGIAIPYERIIFILESLNIKTRIENNTITCIIPPYRDDIVRDCDIIEEIIRVYGYDNINGTLLENARITCGGKTDEAKVFDNIREILTGMRYNECIFYPFAGAELFAKATSAVIYLNQYIKLINPIGEELSYMNRELAPNMLQCVALNLSRKNTDLRLFEIGKVYLADEIPLRKLPYEQYRLSVCATNMSFESFRDDILQVVNCFADKNIKFVRSDSSLLHPGISADIYIEGECCGSFGKVHPQVINNFEMDSDCMYAELLLDRLSVIKRGEIKFEPLAKYPSIMRDFAFVCDEDIAAQDILDEFLSLSLVENASLFDVYRGEQIGAGKKSLAISVMFTDKNKTLQDGDIEKHVNRVLKNIKEKYRAVLR